MQRKLHIPSEQIRRIYKAMFELPHEVGGYFEFKGSETSPEFDSYAQFTGDKLGVTVPSGNYEIHWHTHPVHVIDQQDIYDMDQTGPCQPPSIQDLSSTAAAYYAQDYGMGHVLRRVVFSQEAVYIQYPIPEILDQYSEEMFEKKWWKPFKNTATPIRNKINNICFELGKYINEDTGEQESYYDFAESQKIYAKAMELEEEYLKIAERFGVYVVKITNWSHLLSRGLTIMV